MLTLAMRRSLILLPVLFHLALLVGWRWQQPLVPYFFDATVLSGGRGLDFYSIYQAGYNARHGWDVYEGDPARVEVVVPYFTPFRYLPLVAYTVGAALSLLAPLTAYKVWVVVIELTLWLCLWLTYRRVRAWEAFIPLATLWLCFTPFYLELFMGQFSLIQAALIWGMLLAIQTEGTWIASVLWKINTIVCAPLFLRAHRWRTLGILAVAVLLTTVPYFVVFPAHARDFLLNNFGNSVAGHELGNLGFRQLVFEVLAALGASADLQRWVQLGVVVGVVGLALWLTFWRLSPVASLKPAAISLWVTAFFLISPQIWEHHYVMLLPTLVIAYLEKPHWLIWLVWAGLALPTPFGFSALQPLIAANHDLRAFPLEPTWQLLLQHACKALPTAVWFGYWVRRVWAV